MCWSVFHAIGGVIHAATWFLVIAGGIWFMRRLGSRPRRRLQQRDPVTRSLVILNDRYARGEIDRDEYLERRAYLE